MILTKIVNIYVGKVKAKQYRELGYDCKAGDYIDVKIEDLPQRSHVKVQVQCDYCGKEYEMTLDSATAQLAKYPKIACKDCKGKKQRDVTLEKYGVENTMQLKECKEKIKQTMIERYGVDNPQKSKEIHERQQKTMIEKYGHKCPLNNPEIRTKAFQTINSRYGTDYPLQNVEIRNKAIKTIMERYKGFRLYDNGKYTLFNLKFLGSKNQNHIADLLKAQSNVPLFGYIADMVLDNVIIEYDGSGHQLCIELGELSEDEFISKNRERDSVFLSNGYKILRVISTNDFMPPDDELLRILNKALNKDLLKENYVIIDLENYR